MKADGYSIWLFLSLIGFLGCGGSGDKPGSYPGRTDAERAAALADALLADIDEFTHPVMARAGLAPARIRAGGSATLVAAIKIQPGWHIYAPGGTSPYARPMRLEIKLAEGISPVSDWEFPPGKSTPGGGELIYDGSVAITRLFRAAPGSGPENRSLVCVVYYMACDYERCLPLRGQQLKVDFEIVK